MNADVIVLIETTAINGAYFNELKANYLIPTIEYFNQGVIEEREQILENPFIKYAIVTYQARDCLPQSLCRTIGPFSSAFQLICAIDKLEFNGGKGELCAHLSEGLVNVLDCFEDLKKIRSKILHRRKNTKLMMNINDTDNDDNVQKHCILICNSPPYLMPSLKSGIHFRKTCEQIISIFKENGINLTIYSARKIPELIKLFEKAGGDLNLLHNRHYVKEPRHLVLYQGFILRDRPSSPDGNFYAYHQTDSNSQLNYRPNLGISNQNQSTNQQQNINRNQQIPLSVVQSQVQSETQQNSSVYQQTSNTNWNMSNRTQTAPPPPRWPIGSPQATQQSVQSQLQLQLQLPQQSQKQQNNSSQIVLNSQQSQSQQQQQSSALIAQLNQPPNNVSLHSGVNQIFINEKNFEVNQNATSSVQQHPVLRMSLHGSQSQGISVQQQQSQQNSSQQTQLSLAQQSQQQQQSLSSQQQQTSSQQQQQAQSQQQAQQSQQQSQLISQQNNLTGNTGSAQMIQSSLHSQQQQTTQQPQNQTQVIQPQTQSLLQSQSQCQQQSQAQTQHQLQQPMQFQPIYQVMPHKQQTIWHGVLEWVEKGKLSNEQKIPRQVPCHISSTLKDGEPEIKAEFWPPKLIMQLMPKQLIGNIGNAYLKNSKSVIFYPQNCEALDSLTKFMSTGFAGCVHFTNVPCDIKIILLLYTAEKRSYLGFIPNDQNTFVDRLRKVIQHQKSTSNQRPVQQSQQQVQQQQQPVQPQQLTGLASGSSITGPPGSS